MFANASRTTISPLLELAKRRKPSVCVAGSQPANAQTTPIRCVKAVPNPNWFHHSLFKRGSNGANAAGTPEGEEEFEEELEEEGEGGDGICTGAFGCTCTGAFTCAFTGAPVGRDLAGGIDVLSGPGPGVKTTFLPKVLNFGGTEGGGILSLLGFVSFAAGGVFGIGSKRANLTVGGAAGDLGSFTGF